MKFAASSTVGAVIAAAAVSSSSVLSSHAAQAPTPTPLQERQLGALVGGLVADAAVMPLHWIYNQSDLLFLGGAQPEFHDPPHCHDDRIVTHCDYDYPLGENSPYGQQMRVYLQLFAKQGIKVGSVDASQLVQAYFGYYGNPAGACSNISTGLNSTGCYWDKCTKEFVANVRANASCVKDNACGGDDNQADALAHQVITTILGSGAAPEATLSDASAIVTVTQQNEQAVAFGMAGARMLHSFLSGHSKTPRAAVTDTIAALLDANRVLPNIEDFILAAGLQFVVGEADEKSTAVTLQVGQSCDYPNNLLTGAHMLYQIGDGSGNATGNYVSAIRQLIQGGGDQASRSMFVGSFLGAVAGVDGIPQSWKDRYTHYDEVLQLAKTVVGIE